MSKIPLPKDHEGREIPLDTLVLYDAKGGEMYVSRYLYQCDVLGLSTRWNVISEDALGQCWQHPSDSLYLNPPDSWERLEEDLGKIANHQPEVVCSYFDRGIKDCDGCKLENCECACSHAFLEDVLARIHGLRGEVREDA